MRRAVLLSGVKVGLHLNGGSKMDYNEISIKLLVPYYLCYSYLYYEENKSLISDSEYDIICKRLHKNWDQVEHMHKHLIDKNSLLAGTGYYLKYNDRIRNAARALARWTEEGNG